MRWFVLDVEQLNYYKLKDAKTMFKEVDVDNSGYLDEEEVVDLCRKMGKKLNRKAIQAAMQEMDSDNSGQVDFEEFDRWWASNGGKNASEREAKDPIVLAALTSVMASGDREILITGPSNKGGGNRTYTLRTLPDQLGEQAKWLEALQRLCPSAYEETREGVAPDPAPASHQQQYDGASQFGGGSAGVMDGPVSATFTQPGSLGLGLENTEQSDTILIKTVVAGGAAEHIAGIRPGLQLLRFNGVDCAGKSYAQVIDMLKGAGRPVTLDFITPAQSAVAPPPTASAAERQAAMAAVSAAPAPTAAPASAQASQHSTEFRAAYKQATEAIKDAKASQRVEGADPAESARKYERAAQLARAAADLASEENYRTKLLKTAEQCASIASKNDAAASPAAWSPQPQPEPEPEPEPEQAVTGAGGAAPSLLPSVGQALPAGDSVPAPIPAPAPAVVAEGWGALPQSGDVGGGWGTDSHAGLGQQATAWGSYASDGSTPTASDGSADKVLAAAAAAAAAVEEAKAEAEKASAQARAEERATEQRQAAEKQAALRAENEALEEQRALAAEDAEAAVAAAAAAAEATAELQTELQAARAAQAEAEAEMAAAQATKDAVATEAERAAQQAETEQKAAVAAAAAAAEQAAIEKAAAQQALEAQQQQLQQLQQQLQQQQQRLQKQQASPMVAQLQELKMLFDSSVLTEQEFQLAKRKVLGLDEAHGDDTADGLATYGRGPPVALYSIDDDAAGQSDEEAAATKIQAVYRGKTARSRVLSQAASHPPAIVSLADMHGAGIQEPHQSGRQYLEQEVYPVLQPALTALDQCRPNEPTVFLARCITEPQFLQQKLAEPPTMGVECGFLSFIAGLDEALRQAVQAVCVSRPEEPLHFIGRRLAGVDA